MSVIRYQPLTGLTERRRYDEIRSLYIDQLASAWMEDSTTEATCVSVDKNIDSFVEGDLEHATEMLCALWEIAYKDGDIVAPSSASSAVSPFPPPCYAGMLTSPNQVTQVTSPVHWASVKVALIKSIRKGVFFDRKYWARHSRTGGTLKPVYFSSIVMGDKVEQLNNRASIFDCKFTEVLKVSSGEIPQGPKRFHKRPRWRCQR